ncbi:coiled-coil domain-containing protein 9B isoform X2 [Microcaecilia unicolor]|uniref:Coiled-coil domain-containing protein 9B isoform X2 n=1 Tax=Microcaecilia unicolor TaxID=1415580 RepID=A0A6P7Z1B4_9AMPH|nr:coiled-coil domain-containing protein 9B isoform X2 [Microcaecilia unicolor]
MSPALAWVWNPPSATMHRTDATVDKELRKKEQKDVELDKKIKALRKKNEALIKRYKEIEEDKRNAEQEGMAVTSRKQKEDTFTITVTKNPSEKRIVSEKWVRNCLPVPGFLLGIEAEEEDETDHMFTLQMGKRMQLAVTMDNGKRIVSEKRNSECLPSSKEIPALTKEDVDKLFTFGRGRRMQIAISMDNKAKLEARMKEEKKKSVTAKHSEQEQSKKECEKKLLKSTEDLTLTTTGGEHLQYIQWKKEREQIDLERLARHKNSKGEWRRPWDAEKTGKMFKGRSANEGEPISDGLISKRGGRSTRKFHYKPLQISGRDDGRHNLSTVESVSRVVPAKSSKAKGKDRLTGRARRWDGKNGKTASCTVEGSSVQELPEPEKLKVAYSSDKKLENDSSTLQEESLELPGIQSSQDVSEEKRNKETEYREDDVPSIHHLEPKGCLHHKGVPENGECGSDPWNPEANISTGASKKATQKLQIIAIEEKGFRKASMRRKVSR